MDDPKLECEPQQIMESDDPKKPWCTRGDAPFALIAAVFLAGFILICLMAARFTPHSTPTNPANNAEAKP